VYKIVEKGKEDSEFSERHLRNLSWIGRETIKKGNERRITSTETMEESNRSILPLFSFFVCVSEID
jgi:hypothetical protein